MLDGHNFHINWGTELASVSNQISTGSGLYKAGIPCFQHAFSKSCFHQGVRFQAFPFRSLRVKELWGDSLLKLPLLPPKERLSQPLTTPASRLHWQCIPYFNREGEDDAKQSEQNKLQIPPKTVEWQEMEIRSIARWPESSSLSAYKLPIYCC